MTVNLAAIGSARTGTNSPIDPVMPTGYAIGDGLACWITSAEANNAEPILQGNGYTKLGTYVNNVGAPAFGAGAGPRRVTWYWKVADGDDAVTITPGGSGTTRVFQTTMVHVTKTLNTWKTPVFMATGSVVAANAIVHTFTPPRQALEGELLLAAFAGANGSLAYDTSNPPAFSWGNETHGAWASHTRINSTSGNDITSWRAARSIELNPGAQSTSGNITQTLTFTTASYGSSALILLGDEQIVAAPPAQGVWGVSL